MRVSDLLTMGFCQEYNEEKLISLFGNGDFTWREIVDCDIPVGDKAFCLLRPEFISDSDIRDLAISFLARSESENTAEHSNVLSLIQSENIRDVMSGIYKTEIIYFNQGKKLIDSSEWLLSEIVKCLQ